MKVSSRALLIGLGFATFAINANAQNAPKEGETIVVTGTRVAARSALSTAVPVDVVSAQQLAAQGSTELNQQLAVALPSFNFPRPAITDGTDSVRPATLRGLSPDQTLVLVNGKRRHTSSLVNINGSIGRGSSAVDMNTIPTGAIESVEVLRDGASAQYGSDAIAGVINLRLKKRATGGNLSVTYGERLSDVKTATVPALAAGTTNFNASDIITNPTWKVPSSRTAHDGKTLTVAGWVGLPFIHDGAITISADLQKRTSINRQAYDNRALYTVFPPKVNVNSVTLDPREVTANRLDQQYGDGELLQGTIFANGEIPLSNDATLYGWASVQGRDSTTAAFYRWPSDSRNVTDIYPNGFLPKINAVIGDGTLALGYKRKLGTWDFDTSLNWGTNSMEYTIRDTLNRSYNSGSPTSFYAGGFSNDQTVFNLSGVKQYEFGLASPLNVATGIEARQDKFEIHRGEEGSYYQFTSQDPITLKRTTLPGGSQGFGGFKPENEVDKSRTSVGAYLDTEANVTDAFLLSGAVRYEHYSDFGDNVSGKISGRYDFSPEFALRGSVSTGFRAPSLQQQFFTATSTNVVNGQALEILTIPSTSAIGSVLGGEELRPEKSTNYSIGGVARFGKLTLTIDAYQIKMKDRIVLSENITASKDGKDEKGNTIPVPNAIGDLLVAANLPLINAVRFFMNGVDSTTKGVDVVATYRFNTDNFGKFDIAVTGNLNKNEIDKVPHIAKLADPKIGLSDIALFGRVSSNLLTKAQPKEKGSININWKKDNLGVTFKTNYYGEYVDVNADPALDVTMPKEVVFDLEGRYKFNDKVTFTLGADNITDVYPKMTPQASLRSAGSSTTYAALNAQSALGFSRFSPFGFSGRYVYGKISMDF